MSSGRRQAATSANRVETALNRLDEKTANLQELEAKLAESLIDIDDEWNDKATAIEELPVGLEKADIIDDLIVAYLPVA